MNSTLTAYLAPTGFEKQLLNEISYDKKCDIQKFGNLLLLASENRPSIWAQNIWLNPQYIKISSIQDAANKLKDIQRNWSLYAYHNPKYEHRRAMLIASKLPHISAKPIDFPKALPSSALGAWTLIDRDTILASSTCSSSLPNGEYHFIESKDGPPNRAYLKLWEAFTRLGITPKRGATCLDAGSSPGGWTWVLSRLGLNIVSIDRAPLDDKVAKMPNVHFKKGDGLSVEPSNEFSWVFSDMACKPEKLLSWVQLWIEAVPNINMICTIKLTNATPIELINSFQSIPNSKTVHLFHNKHELTWWRVNPPQAQNPKPAIRHRGLCILPLKM